MRSMTKPTLHVVGMPHTQTTNDSQVCAFTQKAVKFSKMMRDQGYRVNLYWGEENEAECDEHIVCVTKKQQKKWYGTFDPNILPTVEKFNVDDPQWIAMNRKVKTELKKRVEPNDIICLTMGLCHKPIREAFDFPKYLCVEHAVGYSGIFARFACFESYSWMNYLYGEKGVKQGRHYDTVIPNFFFPEQFPQNDPEDYLLFVGRLIQEKGLGIAVDVAKRAGKKLYIAGPGMQSWNPLTKTLVGVDSYWQGDHIDYIGILDPVTRGEVMSRALALLAPTTYIEPFGAVAVEAQLSGTPAITTDFGAFPETVQQGKTGYRIRTIAEGAAAVANLPKLDRDAIRKSAQDRYSIQACGPLYDRWFKQLGTLYGPGGWDKGPGFYA